MSDQTISAPRARADRNRQISSSCLARSRPFVSRTSGRACLRRFRPCRRCPSSRPRRCRRRRSGPGSGRRRRSCRPLERAAIEHPDLLVVAVGDVQQALLLVGRERHVPHRSVAGGRLRDERFLHELAVLLEHLDAIVLAIADIDHAVLGILTQLTTWNCLSGGLSGSYVGRGASFVG